MTPKDFVTSFYKYAKQTEEKSGISAIAVLAQAAQESGWGKVAPGNMFFGVKDTDGRNGNEQLLITTEYSRRQDLKFPEILHVEPVEMHGERFFKYTIKDWFRKYSTPEECFSDHANFFVKNKRYSEALKVKHDPYLFIEEIAKAGYATDPNYSKTLKSIAHSIEQMI
jgi:flagellum-specific peptidoglycan hydrolase FlgJ